ncbi:MAG: ComEC/Rec2 family competence protein, partial [Clostridia bacterium]|nr:ComEC/Rec2 family competence protein [Clostridia bacterium]
MLKDARASMRIPWPAPSFFTARRLMCVSLCYGAGVASARYIPYGQWMFVGAAALFALSLLCRKVRGLFPALVAVSVGLLGLGRSCLEIKVPEMPEFGRWEVSGTVNGNLRHGASRDTFFLVDVAVRPEGSDAYIPIDSALYVSSEPVNALTPSHGQRVGVSGVSYEPTPRRNPGGFDQKSWLAQNGAHVRLYAAGAPKLLKESEFSIKGFALSISQTLADRMDALFGNASSIVRAMLLGDRDDVPDEWRQWMSVSGIAHILSVSGLHVGLWYLILERLLRSAPLSPRARLIILTAFLSFYALLTGLSPSVLRATLMLLFIQSARLARRKVDPLTSLSAAAVCILLFRPLDLFSAGFQMSFCAVFGLSMLRPQLNRLIRIKPAFLSESLTTTVAAQIGILPAQLGWFGYFSLIGFAANLATAPLAGFLIPTATVALLLHAIWPPLAFIPVHMTRGLVAQIVLLSQAASAPSFAAMRLGAMSTAGIATFFMCLALCSSATVWKARARAALMAVLATGVVAAGAVHGDFGARYVQLDVGQALSGVLHSGGRAIVFDTGNAYSDLADYLLYTGSRVEALFLSHPHEDHTSGIDRVLDSRIHIDTLYVPANADAFGAEPEYYNRIARAVAAGAELVEIAAGDALTLLGYPATVIAPER